MRYVSGHPELGQSPEDGFDCSGFVTYVLQQSGLVIPDHIAMDGNRRPTRHANEFADHLGVLVAERYKQPGDLILFSRNGTFPTHVGIVLEGGRYIHAPGKNHTKVCIEPIITEAIVPRPDAGKLLYDTNPICFKALTTRQSEPSNRYTQQVI